MNKAIYICLPSGSILHEAGEGKSVKSYGTVGTVKQHGEAPSLAAMICLD